MSLSVGKFFYKALSDDTSVTTACDGRIFAVARSTEDDAEDKIPYIIIQPEGVTNQPQSKDDEGESQYDSATISLLAVASTYESLVDLTEDIRDCIHSALDNGLTVDTWTFELDSYTFSAGSVQYDPTKPCYYQTLTYVCETYNK